jgi:glycosyltransferase involved in cell wall biosynthesis
MLIPVGGETMGKIRVMQLGSPTGLYGAERWILALLRHLDVRVVDSVVAAIRDAPSLSAPLCGEAKARGFRAVTIDAFGRVNASAVGQLRRYLRGECIHVLHTHGYKTDMIGLLATRGLSCRLVSTPHGWSTQAGLKLRAYEAADRAIFPFFDAVVPLSDTLYEELAKSPRIRRKLSLIRNGIDISEIDSVTTTAVDLQAFKAEGEFVVGYIGQLIARKGLDVALKAFSRLSLKRKKMIIVGDGPQREELAVLAHSLGIASDVRFIGFRSDRLEFLRGFDVFVLASRLEGIPRCLMEAMAAGIPVIASDIPGCTDLIEHGQTGLLFELNSVESLLNNLLDARSPEIAKRLATNGRRHILENYSAAAMSRQYEKIYDRLLCNG